MKYFGQIPWCIRNFPPKDLGITEPAWGDPYETHFDMKMRFAVSFNGIMAAC